MKETITVDRDHYDRIHAAAKAFYYQTYLIIHGTPEWRGRRARLITGLKEEDLKSQNED
jgi:hypothetical protein